MLNLGLNALLSIVIILSALVAITTPIRKLASQEITIENNPKNRR